MGFAHSLIGALVSPDVRFPSKRVVKMDSEALFTYSLIGRQQAGGRYRSIEFGTGRVGRQIPAHDKC